MKSFIDPIIYKFIKWLIDESAFKQSSDCEDDLDRVCIAICSDIITASTQIMSPKHLGYAVHLHQQTGKRSLVEDAYSHGYSISYTELRIFNTSAAVHNFLSQDRTPSGAAVPKQILRAQDGGLHPHVVGDNWDHNERTVDDRGTTHAMSHITVAPKSEGMHSCPRIKRTGKRALDSSIVSGKVFEFKYLL